MRYLIAVLSVLMLVTSWVRADIPPSSPEERVRRNVARVLAGVISNVDALEHVVVEDGADKDARLAAAKAPIQKKIEDAIRQLDAPQLAMFKAMITDREHALNAQLGTTSDVAAKEKIQDQLKMLKTLRERFLTAAVEAEVRAASVIKGDTSRTVLFAGLALGLALASAGVLYARRSWGAASGDQHFSQG